LIENLPEFKALEDEEGRRAAFAKFVKRQKVLSKPLGSKFDPLMTRNVGKNA
jgi:heme oxygenase